VFRVSCSVNYRRRLYSDEWRLIGGIDELPFAHRDLELTKGRSADSLVRAFVLASSRGQSCARSEQTPDATARKGPLESIPWCGAFEPPFFLASHRVDYVEADLKFG